MKLKLQTKIYAEQGCCHHASMRQRLIKIMKWPANIQGVHPLGALKWTFKPTNFYSFALTLLILKKFWIIVSNVKEVCKENMSFCWIITIGHLYVPLKNSKSSSQGCCPGHIVLKDLKTNSNPGGTWKYIVLEISHHPFIHLVISLVILVTFKKIS